MGAVGPAHVMTTLNSEVAVQTRQGAVLSKLKLDAFWNSLGHAEAFDPKVYYDHFHRRWLFVALADGFASTSALLIGVSTNSDPTGNWTLKTWQRRKRFPEVTMPVAVEAGKTNTIPLELKRK